MKAICIDAYGGPEVLQLRDIPKPSLSGEQVLVKVRASSVNPIDWRLRSGELKSVMKLTFPAILGCDIAGEVVEAPAGSRWKVGDAVMTALPGDRGAYAEYLAVGPELLARKPSNMTFEEAGSIPACAGTALQALRDLAKVKPGQSVLVNGASGGVGIFGVQIAKAFGATVTGVCSTANVEMVKSLGADRVIDYKTADVLAGGEAYDVVFDTIGNHEYAEWARVMKPESALVSTLPKSWLKAYLRMFLMNRFTSKKAHVMQLTHGDDKMNVIADLVEQGKVRTVVDKTWPLEQVAAAQEYSASGRTRGKISLTVS
jgi:NADPH:quinone reductase-like Zn-dependent oxidoreductase